MKAPEKENRGLHANIQNTFLFVFIYGIMPQYGSHLPYRIPAGIRGE
jgi:hypothetical protein